MALQVLQGISKTVEKRSHNNNRKDANTKKIKENKMEGQRVLIQNQFFRIETVIASYEDFVEWLQRIIQMEEIVRSVRPRKERREMEKSYRELLVEYSMKFPEYVERLMDGEED